MTRTALAVILIAAVAASAGLLAGLRLAGERSPAFQATGHLYVGVLFGYAAGRRTWFPAVVAGVLSLVELAAFLFLPR